VRRQPAPARIGGGDVAVLARHAAAAAVARVVEGEHAGAETREVVEEPRLPHRLQVLAVAVQHQHGRARRRRRRQPPGGDALAAGLERHLVQRRRWRRRHPHGRRRVDHLADERVDADHRQQPGERHADEPEERTQTRAAPARSLLRRSHAGILACTPVESPALRMLKPSLSWLLVFVPVAAALRLFAADRPLWIFVASAIAIVPLASWMGHATEHLAEHTGEGLGGLLNATFGNAAELIIALAALHDGLLAVVKASLTGSILGNLLLVLGAAFLAGGLRQ